MKDYIKRMIEEEQELKTKIIKLEKFLSEENDISLEQHRLLFAQLYAMQTYRYILHVRIEKESEEEDKE